MIVSRVDMDLVRKEYGHILLNRKHKERVNDDVWVCRLAPVVVQKLQNAVFSKIILDFEKTSFIIIPAPYWLDLSDEDTEKKDDLLKTLKVLDFAYLPVYVMVSI